MTVADYALHQHESEAEALRLQWKMACEQRAVCCAGCGQKRGIEIVFRCLYCGLWFCFECAEKHFGQTVQDFILEKRIERRKELEASYD